MNKLQEILETKATILSEKKEPDGTMEVLVNWAQADKKTKNGRIYGKALLQREIDKLQKQVEKNSLVGNADHPESGLANIKSASHIITGLDLDENGLAWATLKILPTENAGKNIQTLIKNGAEIGVSSRGFGGVDEKTGEVLDDFQLLGIDIVCNPSYEGGILSQNNVLESLDFEEKEESMPSEEAMQEFLQLNFKAFQENRPQNAEVVLYDEWLVENENIVKAVMLTELYHIYPDVETALESLDPDAANRLKSEEKTHVYTPDECYIEARLMNISPDEMAKRLNFAEERKKIDRSSDFSLREAQALISEAESAGTNLSDPKARKEFLEKMKEMPVYSEPTLEERAKRVEKVLISEGKEPGSIENIKKILIHEDEKEEKKRKKQLFVDRWKRDIEQSGSRMSNKEVREFLNEQLKKAGYEKLEEGE